MNESTLTIQRVPDVLDELKDINGAIQQRDRVEVRIALKGIPAQDLSLLLADHELVLAADAFEEHWRVRGASKDYEISTLLVRA